MPQPSSMAINPAGLCRPGRDAIHSSTAQISN